MGITPRHKAVGGKCAGAIAPGRMDGISTSVVVECPYRGLEVFDETHTRFFFGREAMTQHLVEKLRQTRFLTVLGASGSGKSSLARAGLLPKLKAGALPLSERWRYIKFKPGAHPLETLAIHLATENISVDPVTELYKSLFGGENSLHLQVRLGLTKHFPDEKEREQARCFILVDQFEEVFTLCPQEPERLRFIDNLRYAGFTESGQTVIVITMRADFLAQAALYRPLAEIVSDQQFLVSPLDEADTRRMIEAPAQSSACVSRIGWSSAFCVSLEVNRGRCHYWKTRCCNCSSTARMGC